MPSLFNPKDFEENDLWMKACVAQPGEVIDGLAKAQKSNFDLDFTLLAEN